LALSSITVLRVVGSTAAIGTIEFEPGLQHDLPAILDKLIPPSRNYGHEQMSHDGNGHSHLQATPAFCFASLLKGRVWVLIVEPVNNDTTRRTNRDDLFKRMVLVRSD
jgi:hypothetical protein